MNMTDQANQTDTVTEAQTDDIQKPDQLAILKQRATIMGITFSNNIGIEALRAKIDAKLNKEQSVTVAEANDAMDSAPKAPALGQNADRALTPNEQLRREQLALVRCRITNLDPKKRDLPGEIVTVANRVLGTVRKFIPFGELTENGYHIPRVLFNELDSRKFNHVRSYKDKRTGQQVVDSKWVKEFSLEILPPLDQEELNRLATAQIAAGSVAATGDLA